jgi:hypothetical protein
VNRCGFGEKTINEETRSAIEAFLGGFMMLRRKGKPDVNESEGCERRLLCVGQRFASNILISGLS